MSQYVFEKQQLDQLDLLKPKLPGDVIVWLESNYQICAVGNYTSRPFYAIFPYIERNKHLKHGIVLNKSLTNFIYLKIKHPSQSREKFDSGCFGQKIINYDSWIWTLSYTKIYQHTKERYVNEMEGFF